MEQLQTTRVRHSMLLAVHMQLRNYLDCVNHGYLGALGEMEKETLKELENARNSVEKLLKYYFDKEESLAHPF